MNHASMAQAAPPITFRFISRGWSESHFRVQTATETYVVAVWTAGIRNRATTEADHLSVAIPPDDPAKANSMWRHNQPDARVPQDVVDAYNAMTAEEDAPFAAEYHPSPTVAAATWHPASGWRRHDDLAKAA